MSGVKSLDASRSFRRAPVMSRTGKLNWVFSARASAIPSEGPWELKFNRMPSGRCWRQHSANSPGTTSCTCQRASSNWRRRSRAIKGSFSANKRTGRRIAPNKVRYLASFSAKNSGKAVCLLAKCFCQSGSGTGAMLFTQTECLYGTHRGRTNFPPDLSTFYSAF